MSGASALDGGIGRSVRDMVRRTRSVLLACALLVGAAACSGDDDDAAGDLAVYCDKAKVAEALEAEFAANATPDPDELEASFTAFVDAVNEAVAVTPEEIRDEMAINAEAVLAVDKILAANGYDPAAASQDPAMAAFVADERFETAGTAVDEFNQRECGIAAS